MAWSRSWIVTKDFGRTFGIDNSKLPDCMPYSLYDGIVGWIHGASTFEHLETPLHVITSKFEVALLLVKSDTVYRDAYRHYG
jgi:hypothetical protein